jgi:hypothetical protein
MAKGPASGLSASMDGHLLTISILSTVVSSSRPSLYGLCWIAFIALILKAACTCRVQTNRQMVQEHFPWFLRTYDWLPRKIMRADAARWVHWPSS